MIMIPRLTQPWGASVRIVGVDPLAFHSDFCLIRDKLDR